MRKCFVGYILIAALLLIPGCHAIKDGPLENDSRQQADRQVQENQRQIAEHDGYEVTDQETGHGDTGQPDNDAGRSENTAMSKDDFTNNFLINSSIIKYGDSVLFSRNNSIYKLDEQGIPSGFLDGIKGSQLFVSGGSLYAQFSMLHPVFFAGICLDLQIL